MATKETALTRDQISAKLSELDSNTQALVVEYPDDGAFWPAFGKAADSVADSVGSDDYDGTMQQIDASRSCFALSRSRTPLAPATVSNADESSLAALHRPFGGKPELKARTLIVIYFNSLYCCQQ